MEGRSLRWSMQRRPTLAQSRTGTSSSNGIVECCLSELLAISYRESLVPGVGLEPTRPHGQRILSPLRLPIPPPGRDKLDSILGSAAVGWDDHAHTREFANCDSASSPAARGTGLRKGASCLIRHSVTTARVPNDCAVTREFLRAMTSLLSVDWGSRRMAALLTRER